MRHDDHLQADGMHVLGRARPDQVIRVSRAKLDPVNEATVDGVHLTDLGFLAYAERMSHFLKILLN